MRAYCSDRHRLPLPPGHRFPVGKYALLRERLAAHPGLTLVEAPAASDAELALAHDPAYVRAVVEGRLTATQQREIGFPWSPQMVERSRRSVGATIAAARAALEEGVAANLAGGTHHASAGKGSGYCVFNDVAVAARVVQADSDGRGLRIAVVDLDVHQGNGTASIFRDDATVYTLSLHGARNFPFRKEPSDLDVELPDGCADDAYLDALDGALAAMWRHHAGAPPGLVFYLAGADPHEHDRLGRLKLTDAGLAERDRRVLDAARARGVPLVLTMAGGYGRVIEETVAIQATTVDLAWGSWNRWNNAPP
jgi:acetoin utilization deacetylase AcuC-like enzyme